MRQFWPIVYHTQYNPLELLWAKRKKEMNLWKVIPLRMKMTKLESRYWGMKRVLGSMVINPICKGRSTIFPTKLLTTSISPASVFTTRFESCNKNPSFVLHSSLFSLSLLQSSSSSSSSSSPSPSLLQSFLPSLSLSLLLSSLPSLSPLQTSSSTKLTTIAKP